MESQRTKGILLPTLIGGLFLFLAAFIVALGALANLIPTGTEVLNGVTVEYGVQGALRSYFQLWSGGFPHWTTYIAEMMVILSGLILLANLVLCFIKRERGRIVSAILFSFSIAAFPYFLVLIVPLAKFEHMTAPSTFLVSLGVALNVMSMLSVSVVLYPLLSMERKQARIDYEPRQSEPAPERPREGLTEKDVRAIANELIHEHVLDRHKNPISNNEPDQDVELIVEERPLDIPGLDEEPLKDITFGNGRKKTKFETRLRESDYDIRHKYYDLRDYLKWYGLNNRVSIPGDTFTLRRRRLAFITISGKHIKLYLALDPDRYLGSAMPVEAVASKKFDDLPCLLKVRSDLSYRRAKHLIDDLMKNSDVPKPSSPEPKETQEQR